MWKRGRRKIECPLPQGLKPRCFLGVFNVRAKARTLHRAKRRRVFNVGAKARTLHRAKRRAGMECAFPQGQSALWSRKCRKFYEDWFSSADFG